MGCRRVDVISIENSTKSWRRAHFPPSQNRPIQLWYWKDRIGQGKGKELLDRLHLVVVTNRKSGQSASSYTFRGLPSPIAIQILCHSFHIRCSLITAPLCRVCRVNCSHHTTAGNSCSGKLHDQSVFAQVRKVRMIERMRKRSY